MRILSLLGGFVALLLGSVAISAIQPANASVPASQDRNCVSYYNEIARNLNAATKTRYVTDDEISWALRYERAEREGLACPAYPKSGAQSGTMNTAPKAAPKAAPGRTFKGNSNARSGTRSCTKSNGSSGKQYWYYGFDNKKKYGACV